MSAKKSWSRSERLDYVLAHTDRNPCHGGCWLWKGAKQKNGYGTTVDENRRRVGVHRFVYEATHGVVLARKQLVCHTCDVRACCNPDHLWRGSYSDNVQDMVTKGRHGAQSRFSDADVAEMLAAVKRGERTSSVAARFGVSTSYLSTVLRGRWLRRQASGVERIAKRTVAKLTPATAADIRREFASGASQSALARKHRVSVSTVHLLVHGKTWRTA